MALSTLCVQCGLCCDGSLFLFVAITAAEAEQLPALGIGVATHRDRLTMPLPCGRLDGRCCTVYPQRPQGCRSFVCRLGQRLEAGELGLDQALPVVAEAQRRVAAVREALPGVRTLRAAQLALGDPAQQPSSEAVERIHLATAWLRAHF